jgi:S-layer protein (TIGR01567 family)
MNKKITIVALVALMLLTAALPASAAIQATSVEIRGTVANQTAITGGFNLTNVGGSDAPTWTAQSFAGFYYDIKDNLGAENLQIIENVTGRTIAQDKLIYTTYGQGKMLKVVENTGGKTYQNASDNGLEKFGLGEMATDAGKYNIVGWQAENYVGIKNQTSKLAKLLIEQGTASSEKKTLTIGETWDIGGGWTLSAQSIDAKATPRQVWLVLSKDGVKKDDKVISEKKIFTYVEKSIGGESDVPIFVTYIDSVFAGATSDMVQLRYTWAIDTSITEIKGGDKFGVFKVQSISPIRLNNTDNTVTLSKDSTVALMGNMKFKVADSDVVRIYPMVLRTAPGIYEVRGTVANQTAITGGFNLTNVGGSDAPTWTAQSFAGFYYDSKDNLGAEQLQIIENVTGRTIAQDKLIYTTYGQGKMLKVVENTGGKTYQNASDNGLEKFGLGEMATDAGKYNIVGWQAENYVGIKNQTSKLAKLLIEQGTASSEKKTLTIGETWDIGGGWTLSAQSIDAKATPRQVWLVLSKDGVKKDDKVISEKKIFTYVEKSIGGESDVPIFVTYIDSVFAGATSDMVQLRYTWAIDTSITEIKGGDKFGVFKVQSISPIRLNNTDNTVTLSKDSTVALMGNMKFKVADSDVVRIYPMVEYEIKGVTPTGTPSATPGVGTPSVTPVKTPLANATVTTPEANVTAAAAVATAAAAAATTKGEPGFEAIYAIAGLLAVAFLVLRQRK